MPLYEDVAELRLRLKYRMLEDVVIHSGETSPVRSEQSLAYNTDHCLDTCLLKYETDCGVYRYVEKG